MQLTGAGESRVPARAPGVADAVDAARGLAADQDAERRAGKLPLAPQLAPDGDADQGGAAGGQDAAVTVGELAGLWRRGRSCRSQLDPPGVVDGSGLGDLAGRGGPQKVRALVTNSA